MYRFYYNNYIVFFVLLKFAMDEGVILLSKNIYDHKTGFKLKEIKGYDRIQSL